MIGGVQIFFIIPEQAPESRSWTVAGRFAAETFQSRIATFSGVRRLPHQHHLPRILVVYVVYFDDGVHVGLLDIALLPFPALAQHRIPEHLLAGVYPIFLALLCHFRYCRCLSVCGQRKWLTGRWILIGRRHLQYANSNKFNWLHSKFMIMHTRLYGFMSLLSFAALIGHSELAGVVAAFWCIGHSGGGTP